MIIVLSQQTVVEPEPAQLMSIFRPIVCMIVTVAWAWVVSRLDKDANRFHLGRHLWNGVQMVAGIFAFFLWLYVLPFFWLGLLVAMAVFTASIGGYVLFRNTKLPEAHQWYFSADSLHQWWQQKEAVNAQKSAVVHLMRQDGAPIEVPAGTDPNVAAHQLFEQVMDFALPRAADRFEIAADATKAMIGVRIDGVQYPQPPAEPRVAVALIDYLKQHAGMDLEDRRRRQRGRLLIEADGFGRHEFSIASAGSTRELNLVVQIDQQKATLTTLENLGLLDVQRRQLEPVLTEQRHLVIAACPAHQGLTTTMTSFVARHDPYTQSIMTLEDEVEVELEGVTHETIETGSDADAIERRLAAIFRGDPAVVMVNRLIDASHARLIAQAVKEMRVYLGLNQDDTFSAVRLWLKAVGDMEMGAQALGAVVAQRLVRKLCPTCRIAYKPNPEVLKKLNLPADRVPQLYKHSGQVVVGRDRKQECPTCHGLGFRGRIGVFEVLVLDDEARQILSTGQLDQFRAHARRRKMIYLQETALLKVVEGLTSISEITRALGNGKTK